VTDFDGRLDQARRDQVCAECGDDLYYGNSPRGGAFCSTSCSAKFRGRRRYQENRECLKAAARERYAAKKRHERQEPPTS